MEKQAKGFKPPKLFGEPSKYYTTQSKGIELEDAKAQLWTSLSLQAKALEPSNGDFEFAVNDCKLYAGRDFTKNEIKLVPMTDAANKLVPHTEATPPEAVTVKVGSVHLVINPPSSKALVAKVVNGEITMADFEKAKPVVVPFWWVNTAIKKEKDDKKDDANMKVDKIGCGDMTLPGLTNSRAVKKGEQLLLPEPTKKKRKIT